MTKFKTNGQLVTRQAYVRKHWCLFEGRCRTYMRGLYLRQE